MSTVMISAAVLSFLRKEVSLRSIADRFGVAEAQVQEWVDIFTIGGVLSLSEACGGAASSSQKSSREAFATRRSEMFRQSESRPVNAAFELTDGDSTTTGDPRFI